MKIGIILHIGNYEMIEYYEKILLNLAQFLRFEMFITISKKESGLPELIDNLNSLNIKLKKNKSSINQIFNVDNKGYDIYPFIKVIEHFIENKLEFDICLKLHTKTNNEWRNKLVLPLIDKYLVKLILKNIKQNNKIGIIGSPFYHYRLDRANSEFVIPLSKKYFNYDFTKYYDKIVKSNYTLDVNFYKYYEQDLNSLLTNDFFYYDSEEKTTFITNHYYNSGINEYYRVYNKNLIESIRTKSSYFIAGTIFWFQPKVLIDEFKKIKLNDKFYSMFPFGYLSDAKTPQIPHSWERIFSLLYAKNNYKVISTLHLKPCTSNNIFILFNKIDNFNILELKYNMKYDSEIYSFNENINEKFKIKDVTKYNDDYYCNLLKLITHINLTTINNLYYISNEKSKTIYISKNKYNYSFDYMKDYNIIITFDVILLIICFVKLNESIALPINIFSDFSYLEKFLNNYGYFFNEI